MRMTLRSFALGVIKILGLGGVDLFLLCSSLPLNAAKTSLIGIDLCDGLVKLVSWVAKWINYYLGFPLGGKTAAEEA